MTIPCTKLQNGVNMPIVGFGTSQGTDKVYIKNEINPFTRPYAYIERLLRPDKEIDCDDALLISGVKQAIDCGYRLFDTAQVTHTEAGVGEAIQAKIQEGKVTREELFIIAKLWCTDHKREDVKAALGRALRRMRLNYVDLYLVHFPVAFKPSTDCLYPRNENGAIIFADDDIDLTETWQGMEDVLSTGLTRAIGISNFNMTQIKRILHSCKVRPMSLHVESNPYFQNRTLISFCEREGIPITGFCPLHKPGRTWQTGPDVPYVSTDPVLLKIGLKYGKTPQQVALRFQIQRGISLLVKTNTPSRMIENMQLFDFQLTLEEMEEITALDRHFRILTLESLRPSREYPFEERNT